MKWRLLTCCGISSVLSNRLHISVHKYCSHRCSLSIGHLEVSRPDSAPFLFLLDDLIRTAITWSSSKRQTSNKVPLPVKLQGADVYWVCRRFSTDKPWTQESIQSKKCQADSSILDAVCRASAAWFLKKHAWQVKMNPLSQNSWISFQLWSLAVKKIEEQMCQLLFKSPRNMQEWWARLSKHQPDVTTWEFWFLNVK